MFERKSGGFRIYNDTTNNTFSKDTSGNRQNIQDPDLQIAMLQKLHAETKIFALLVFKGEIKGIRYFDAANWKFIDIAPWQINFFNISGMRLSGVRELELLKVDNGSHNHTLVIEYMTEHEIKKYYKPNRMTSNELAKALSYTMNYLDDNAYSALLGELKSN